MRFIVITFLIILSLGVFGFPFLLGAGAMMDHGFCMVAKVFGTSCPAGGVFGVALHHISSVGEMTLAVTGFAAVLLLIFILAFSTAGISIVDNLRLIYRFENVFTEEPRARILRWLSLHNKLDPHPVSLAGAERFLVVSRVEP